VRIALLNDYAITAFEHHEDIVASFVPALLRADTSGELTVDLQRSLESQHHAALQALAEHAVRLGDRALTRRCFVTLRERANNLHRKRMQVYGESEELTRAILVVGALDGAQEIDGVIRVALRNQRSGHAAQVLGTAARELRELDDGKRLRELLEQSLRRTESDGAQFSPREDSDLVREATLHALERGWNVPQSTSTRTGHATLAIYATLRTGSRIDPGEPVFPDVIDAKDRLLQYDTRIARPEEFFRASFHVLLANHLLAHPDRNQTWLIKQEDGSWMSHFLVRLDDVAREFANSLSNKEPRPHCWLFEAMGAVPRPMFRGNQNVDECRLANRAASAVTELAFDLASIRAGCGLAEEVTGADLEFLSRSDYCIFPDWLDRYARLGRTWMSRSTWKDFCAGEECSLLSSLTSLPDRSRRLSSLARAAAVQHEGEDAKRLIRLAAEGLVAHGDHKDMLLHDLVLSVNALCTGLHRASWPPTEQIRRWLKLLTPAVVFVGRYTDGDETHHLPSELSRTLSLIAPEFLPAYYRWLSEEEEYDDASEAFAAFLKVADLSDPYVQAIARTAVERRGRLVLQERARAGEADAAAALETIEGVFGQMRVKAGTDDGTARYYPDPAQAEPLPLPDEYPPERFEQFLRGIESRYDERDEAVIRWAEHWEHAGTAPAVLDAFEGAYERGERVPALDVPYRIARELGDRDGAFRWLVRASREASSWYWTNEAEEKASSRWRELRQSFRERWLLFLRDTIRRYGYPVSQAEPWRGTVFGHGGFSRLVKYCLILGETERATEVVDAIVLNTAEYVSPLRFPDVSWVEECAVDSDERTRHIDLLLARLTWPSALVRERACDALGALLADGELSEFVRTRFEDWASKQHLESTSVLALLACCRAREYAGAVGTVTRLELPISKPSVLSNYVLGEFKPGDVVSPSAPGHSGDAPQRFVPNPFFQKHVGNFLPPLFIKRAKSVERIGAHGFCKQWAFEWSVLQDRLKIPHTTEVLDYWFKSSSYREPNRAADPPMSELFRSAYLRAIAWATDRGLMPAEGANYLAAETCPVDLGLWRTRTGRRPEWWPQLTSPDGSIDDLSARLVGRIGALRAAETDNEPLWGAGWSLAHASGRVFEGEAIYDAEIIAFLQSSFGPVPPQPEEVWRYLERDDMFGNAGVVTKASEVNFRGHIQPVDAEDALQPIGDWKVLRLAGNGWATYPVMWQWWRLHRPVWLPFNYFGVEPAGFLPEVEAVVVRRGNGIVGRWHDWTDGLEETLDHELTPPSGSYLLLRLSELDELASRTGMVPAWALRITCFHRKDYHEPFKTHRLHQILGARTIILPD
jgi:hypothetical protein